MKDFQNEQEVVSEMARTGRKYVIFEGSVYDVTEYMTCHPGGQDKIEELLG
jgi:cytochrome b involved in lipid metabolism